MQHGRAERRAPLRRSHVQFRALGSCRSVYRMDQIRWNRRSSAYMNAGKQMHSFEYLLTTPVWIPNIMDHYTPKTSNQLIICLKGCIAPTSLRVVSTGRHHNAASLACNAVSSGDVYCCCSTNFTIVLAISTLLFTMIPLSFLVQIDDITVLPCPSCSSKRAPLLSNVFSTLKFDRRTAP